MSQIHFSNKTDEWSTPISLLRKLDHGVHGFHLDPCSGAETRSIIDSNFTKADNGLERRWFGDVWMNPPYSEISEWMEKALLESQRHGVTSITALVPARTSTQWFHNFAVESSALCFIEGRLSFGDSENSAPFPSMIAVFNEVPDGLLKVLETEGVVYKNNVLWATTVQGKLQ